MLNREVMLSLAGMQAHAERPGVGGSAARVGGALLAARRRRARDRPQAARHPGSAWLQLRGAQHCNVCAPSFAKLLVLSKAVEELR